MNEPTDKVVPRNENPTASIDGIIVEIASKAPAFLCLRYRDMPIERLQAFAARLQEALPGVPFLIIPDSIMFEMMDEEKMRQLGYRRIREHSKELKRDRFEEKSS